MYTQLDIKLPSPLEELSVDSVSAKEYRLWVKRDDLIHPIISGNKWRKLTHIFETTAKPSHISSFGGGHSNHLHALGYICHALKISFTANIRGNYTDSETPCIKDLVTWGASIKYLNKVEFKTHRETQTLSENQGQLCIPEGGFTEHALMGVGQIVNELILQLGELAKNPLTIVLPVATGTTLAGLATALPAHWQVLGIAVLKGKEYLENNVQALLKEDYENWRINHDFHGGGYAKTPPELSDFLATWQHENCPLEPVYSGKAVWGLTNLIRAKKINTRHIIYLHTGGLQGARKN